MGNEQSKKYSNVQIELNHPRINFVRVINEPKKRYMQTVFSIEGLDYLKWKDALEKAKFNSNHLLIPFQHKFESKEFCGTSGSVLVNYENYPYLLVEQIQNRRAKKKGFDETELWLLLFCLLEAHNQMQRVNSSRIGDVRPQNIFFNENGTFMSEQLGNIKVANLLSWPKEVDNFQKFLQNQQSYLAPQDMPLIQSLRLDNSQNKLSQIYSIGLTVLSAAHLRDFKTLYNPVAKRFNIQEFSLIMNEWRLNESYSDIFKATLSSLLQPNPEQRIPHEILWTWIEQYKEFILAKKDFTITDPPKLIINQVQMIRKLYESTSSKFTYTQPVLSSTLNSEFKQVGAPLEGSRRLVQQKRYAPITVIPGTSVAESVYSEKPTLLSNYLLQGAPITTVNPTFVNRTSVPVVQQLSESVYARNWSSQGSSIPQMKFQYSSSPERNLQEPRPQENAQTEQNNQPEIQEDQSPKQQQNE